MWVLYVDQLECENVGFSIGRKTSIPREKPLELGENPQQTQPIHGTRLEYGYEYKQKNLQKTLLKNKK